tara:strand:- start:726 stop:1169 length:444 start_codon:yes stop_codon:yes gene_type:complete
MSKFVVLFVFAWLAFAFFEIDFDRSVFKAYTASERDDSEPGDGLPKLILNGIVEYRVRGDEVVRKSGSYIDAYNNCTVFDLKNWSCTHSDESATFGVKEGDYFSETNLSKFPHLTYLPHERTLSRFGYIVLKCRWNYVACPFTPFIL